MSETQEHDDRQSAETDAGLGNYGPDGDGKDDGQDYVDRSKIDFDPADGLYSGTAVDGTSDIPGPHESGEGDSEGDSGGEGDREGGGQPGDDDS